MNMSPTAPIERPEHAGFDRVEEITMSITVRADDGRTSQLELVQFDREIVAAEHRTPAGALVLDAQIAANLLESLPEWFRRELGFAALAAQGEQR